MAFAPFEIALHQQGVRLFVRACGHGLDTGEEHAAVTGTGQCAVATSVYRILKVVKVKCRAFEKLVVRQAGSILPREAVESFGGQV
ncbi:hypothetical protein D3C85_1655690 [compost metagenome]